MNLKDLLTFGLAHPGDLLVLARYWLQTKRRDITLPSELGATGYDRKTMRRCWDLLDMTSTTFSSVIKELDGELARVVRVSYHTCHLEPWGIRLTLYAGLLILRGAPWAGYN